MLKGLIYSVVSAVCFGMMAPIAKLGYGLGLSEMLELQYRFNFGLLIFFIFLLVKDRSMLRVGRATLFKTAFLGLVIYVIQSTCFFRAALHIPASTTALIFYLYPVTVTLLSMAVFKLKLDRNTVLSLVLVTSGCGLVFYDAFLKQINMTGVLYALGAMAVFSTYLILVQVLLKGERPLTATFYVLFFACISFNILGGSKGFTDWTPEKFLIGGLLGLVCTAMAVSLLFLAIEQIGSAMVSIFSTCEPIATLIAAHLMLGEPVNILQIFGVVFIVTGIIMPNAHLLLELRRTRTPS